MGTRSFLVLKFFKECGLFALQRQAIETVTRESHDLISALSRVT